MSTGLEFGAFLTIVALVFGSLLLLNTWTRAIADWLWLLAINGRLVGTIGLAVLMLVMMALNLVFGLHFLSPLTFAVGLILAPILSIPLANLIAFRSKSADQRWGRTNSRDFIFEAARRQQSENYSAPPIDP